MITCKVIDYGLIQLKSISKIEMNSTHLLPKGRNSHCLKLRILKPSFIILKIQNFITIATYVVAERK